MKSIFKGLLSLLLIVPLCLSAQKGKKDADTEDAAGTTFITGSLQLDEKGKLFFASSDCRYNGKYYLAGSSLEGLDKKDAKKMKKKNKAVDKKIAKFTKKVTKADGKILPNREVKCLIDEKANTINPIKVISPMYEPKVTGTAPLCDATLLAIYALYVETERIKKMTRVVTFKKIKTDGDTEEMEFYDINCNKIGYDQLTTMMPEIKSVLKQANIALAANIAAVAIVLANQKAISEELKALGGLETIMGMKSLVEAGVFQVRLVNDNKRLRDRIKECKKVLKGFGFED
tara:strand:- start:216 stop:1079 length:864 start_codon:yes stop_codon:yes gene_type:complete